MREATTLEIFEEFEIKVTGYVYTPSPATYHSPAESGDVDDLIVCLVKDEVELDITDFCTKDQLDDFRQRIEEKYYEDENDKKEAMAEMRYESKRDGDL